MAKGKRAHSEGTYKKRKDGRWEAQYNDLHVLRHQAQERLRPHEGRGRHEAEEGSWPIGDGGVYI